MPGCARGGGGGCLPGGLAWWPAEQQLCLQLCAVGCGACGQLPGAAAAPCRRPRAGTPWPCLTARCVQPGRGALPAAGPAGARRRARGQPLPSATLPHWPHLLPARSPPSSLQPQCPRVQDSVQGQQAIRGHVVICAVAVQLPLRLAGCAVGRSHGGRMGQAAAMRMQRAARWQRAWCWRRTRQRLWRGGAAKQLPRRGCKEAAGQQVPASPRITASSRLRTQAEPGLSASSDSSTRTSAHPCACHARRIARPGAHRADAPAHACVGQPLHGSVCTQPPPHTHTANRWLAATVRTKYVGAGPR